MSVCFCRSMMACVYIYMFLYVCVSCEPASEHTLRCVTRPRALIFSHTNRFATGTIIFVEKQNEHHNPFPKWPRHGAADNHIICRFNWKYKSQCTHHYGQLWYTPCRLMHDDTSQMWRVTRVTFKYHGTLGNLIGAPTTHLNSCPCMLLSEITSSTVSFCCRLDWLYFFFSGHFLHLTEHGTAHVVVAVVFLH